MSTSRSRMALAPLSVNVRHKIFSGNVSVFFRILATRILKSSVLPVPGPAITITGPSIESTADAWAVFSFL